MKGDSDTRNVRTPLALSSSTRSVSADTTSSSIANLQNRIQTSARHNACRPLGKVSCDTVLPAVCLTNIIGGCIGNNGKAISIRVHFTQYADTCFVGKWLILDIPKLIYLGLEIDTVGC